MEIIKRKISLEDITSRKSDSSYGLFTGDTFYISIMLTQNYDDMGMFNNFEINTDALIEELEVPFVIITGDSVNTRYITDNLPMYETPSLKLSGLTEDRLEEVRNYDENDIYRANFDINRDEYINYTGATIQGRDRVTVDSDPIEYVTDANNDGNIGTLNQNDGFFIKTFSGLTREVNIGGNLPQRIPRTEIYYNSQGWNGANVGFSGLTKEEYLFGITSEPEVFSDVFIERGIISVKEKHLKLTEIKSLEDLVNYGNGLYNVTK